MSAPTIEKPAGKWRMIIDVARCEGCNNCFMACKDEHVDNAWPPYTGDQARHGERWIRVPVRERGRYPMVDIAYRPEPCHHCADAPCVALAPDVFRQREDGLVMMDIAEAKGRPELVEACPYGAVVVHPDTGTAQKCTFCAHLLDDGWTTTRCVQACGPGSLVMARLTDEEMADRVRAEGLSTISTGSAAASMVFYKNLHRYDREVVAGQVASRAGGVEDCAAGVTVTLHRGEADGEKVATTVTDAWGEFRFDDLKTNSGAYTVVVAGATSQPLVTVPVTLGRSQVLDLLIIDKEEVA